VPSSWTLLTLHITHYTLTQNESCASAGRELVGLYVVTDVCIETQKMKNNCEREPEEAHYCMVLLQQYGRVFLDMYHLEFLWRRSGRLVPVAGIGLNDPLLLLNSLRIAPWC